MFANLFSFKNTSRLNNLCDYNKELSDRVAILEANEQKLSDENNKLRLAFAAMEDDNILLQQENSALYDKNAIFGNALIEINNTACTKNPNATVKRMSLIAQVALGVIQL